MGIFDASPNLTLQDMSVPDCALAYIGDEVTQNPTFRPPYSCYTGMYKQR